MNEDPKYLVVRITKKANTEYTNIKARCFEIEMDGIEDLSFAKEMTKDLKTNEMEQYIVVPYFEAQNQEKNEGDSSGNNPSSGFSGLVE